MSRFLKVNENKKERGITLIALITTIIVLLILAGISIGAITGSNGIIGGAQDAKEETEISQEKEIIDISTVEAMGKNNRGNLQEEEFQDSIDKHTNGKAIVSDVGEEFEVFFEESGRYYSIDKDGNILSYDDVAIDKSPGDITKDENGDDIEEGQPYEIWCIEDLVEWSENYQNYQNSNIVLGRTLNFKSNYSYSNGKMLGCNSIEELKELLTNTEGTGFTPINSFYGTFDGKNFEIQNIYENVSEGYAGLFARGQGTIQNLGITGSINSLTSAAGGLVGYAEENVFINNCYNSASINAKNSAGGIIGYIYAGTTARNCINCYNKGSIQGNSAGGIIGGTTSGAVNIYNCYNVGRVKGENAGGIMGYKYHNTRTEIKNVYNYSKVEGTNNQGDIIGYNWASSTSSSPTIENVFYTNQTIGPFGVFANAIGTPLYCEDISDNKIVTKLNDYVSSVAEQDRIWKSWTLGKEGYPIFE